MSAATTAVVVDADTGEALTKPMPMAEAERVVAHSGTRNVRVASLGSQVCGGAIFTFARTDEDLDREQADLTTDMWADDDAAREALASLEAERRGDQARDEAWS